MVEKRVLDAEYGVLGALLLDAKLCAAEIFDGITPDDFLDSPCRAVFETARELYREDRPIDVLTVSQKMGAEYRDMLREILEITPTAHNYRGYIEALRQCARQHRARTLADQIALDAAQGAEPAALRTAAEQLVEELSEAGSRDAADMTALMTRAAGRLGQPRTYYDFGFPRLSRNLLFGPGKYVILAARPSVGKTALALQIALELAKRYRVAFFSCEAGQDEIADRILAAETWVDYARLQMGTSTAEEIAAVAQSTGKLAARQLTVIDAAGMTAGDMTARALRLRAQVMIVDYVQIVAHGDPKATEFNRVTEVSRALQMFAKRHHVAVLALSQLSRIGEEEAPELHHLRSSGQLEQDADAVLLLHRPVPGPDVMQNDRDDPEDRRRLKLAKNRNGKVGSFDLWFFGAQQRFLEQWEGFHGAAATGGNYRKNNLEGGIS